MISKELCVKIFNAYREIEKAKDLRDGIDEALRKAEDVEPTFSNAFGDRVGLQLGVPSGPNSHRLFGVSPSLCKELINKHIEIMTDRLAELHAENKEESK